jgi:hypothetical protein
MRFHLDESKNTITVDLNVAKARTKAQQLLVKQLVKSGQLEDTLKYLETFSGKRGYLNLERTKSQGINSLENKASNGVAKLLNNMLRLTVDHTPFNNDKTFVGVEIECFIPFENAFHTFETPCIDSECDSCCGRGTSTHEIEDDDGSTKEIEEDCSSCSGTGRFESEDCSFSAVHEDLRYLFRKNKVKCVNVKEDGSLREPDGYFPVEITVLTRLDKPDNLKHVCELLSKLGAKVNKSCGMHVHLDARHLTKKQVRAIGEKFKRVIPVLSTLVPKTRRENDFCKLAVSGFGGGRYYAVNLTAFNRYQTIEVRLHSSTTDFDKIINWSRLLSAIMYAPRIREACHDLNTLTEYIRIDENLVEYFTQRIALFSPELDTTISNNALDRDEVA